LFLKLKKKLKNMEN